MRDFTRCSADLHAKGIPGKFETASRPVGKRKKGAGSLSLGHESRLQRMCSAPSSAAVLPSNPRVVWSRKTTHWMRPASERYDLVTQLPGKTSVRQGQGVRHAIQENGDAMQAMEEAAVAVHILSKD